MGESGNTTGGKTDNLTIMNSLTSTDYAAERERLRSEYSKKKMKKKDKSSSSSKKPDKITITLGLLGVFAAVLIIVFISMMMGAFGKKSGSKTGNSPAGSSMAKSSETTVPGNSEDSSISEDTSTEATTQNYVPVNDEDVEEMTYISKKLNDTWYNMDKYRALCKDVPDEYFDDVCFIGDSRTQGLLEYSVLPRRHGFYKVGSTANAACLESAYTLDGVNYTNILNIIASVDYDIFYVGYGTNELGYGDADKFIEELKVVIDCIREYHPNAIIYVENVLPMGSSFSQNNPSFSNSRANEYNRKLLKMCQEYGDLIYLDIASCMRDDDGAALYEYISDGLHYTPEGYRVIMEFIRGAVVEKRNAELTKN
ncbi:MAG: SGNH/GDSL hydrolase family protein [Eubacterium sp.]|nr:SGNH/GDSL hydrolase family protein [Eubacterium sp.]